ncbi:MAG: LmbU family transcriptional regulator [Saccharothrix sp.]|nr:LmbU family transcriptional regulator [Saccharothrix sp.]
MTTPIGLSFPGATTFDTWERAGHQIARIANSSAWYLGDWLVYGQDKYTDRYRRAVDAAGLDYQTLRNYAWVARSFEYSRRREALSFQHHAEVASLPPQDQDRWLDLAERHAWSRNRLRREIRDSRAGRESVERAVLPQMSVALVNVARWRRAAAEAKTEFEEWIVASLDQAADRVLSESSHPFGGHAPSAVGVNAEFTGKGFVAAG